GHPAAAAHGRDTLAEAVRGQAGVVEHLLSARLDGRQRDEQVVGGDVLVLHAGGEVHRGGQHAREGGGRGGPLDGRPAGAGQAADGRLGGGSERGDVDAGLGDQAAGRAVLLAQQGRQQVDGLGGAVPGRGGGHLGDVDRLATAGGELFGGELAHTDCWFLVS